MKKMKLRAWVKVVITLSILIGTIVFAIKYIQKQQVGGCMEAVNSRTICEKVLYE